MKLKALMKMEKNYKNQILQSQFIDSVRFMASWSLELVVNHN